MTTKNQKYYLYLLLGIMIGVILFFCTSCTENSRAKNFGGTTNISVPAGQQLLEATWKGDDLWILTQPMPEGYVPVKKTFSEKSSYGLMSGTIYFTETKSK